MKSNTKLILMLMAAASQVSASPLGATSNKGDTALPKGEAMAEARGITAFDPNNDAEHHHTSAAPSADKDKEDKFAFTKVTCDEAKERIPEDLADTDPLYTGVEYLRGLEGNFTLENNGCARVSCSWRAGVHICWDKYPETFTAPWGHIADGVEVLLDRCTTSIHDTQIRGEAEDGNGVRVKVQRSNC